MIKRIVADTMPEALAKVRRELGANALIVDTRKIYEKRWMGLKRTARLEVWATTDLAAPESRHEGVSAHSKVAPVKDKNLYDEITKIRSMLQNALNTQDSLSRALIEQLTEQGISKSQAAALIGSGDLDLSESCKAKDTLKAHLMSQLKQLNSEPPMSPRCKVALFVGPTGVGKTTTIAKIAATEALTKGRRVGLITADTFRVGAIDQLKTYAKILNTPFEVAYKNEELKSAVKKLDNLDLILIDTAGRNYRAESYVDEVCQLLEGIPIDETFLVLSLTAKVSDMAKVAEKFEKVPVDKFIFTKLDETDSYGSIIDVLLTYKKPISYFTIGQNVPSDIEVASLEKIVTHVLDGVE